jgi:tetratricopeptide (TPR) repeat protein
LTTNAAAPDRATFPRVRRIAAALRRRPRLTLLSAFLLGLLVVGGALLFPHARALYHARAAERAIARRDFDEARGHLAVCLEAWPDRASTLLLAARTARRAGRFDEAERHLAHLQARHGTSDQTALEWAMLSAERGDLGKAEVYLKSKVGPDHPDAPLVYEALAHGYLLTDRPIDLLDCTDAWLQVRPGDSQALYYRGRAWERLTNWDKAAEAHRQAVEADPDNDDARLHLAQLLLLMDKDAAQALDHFERVRARRPSDPDVILGLAGCQKALGHPDAARELLDGLLTSHPNHPRALGQRGQLALDEGDPARAEDLLRRAFALAPEDREALNGLIRALAAQGKKEAQELEPRLEQLNADLSRYHDLVRAAAKDPGNLALRTEAATICLRLGRKADARRWLAGVLQIDSNYAPALELLEKAGLPSQPAGDGPP